MLVPLMIRHFPSSEARHSPFHSPCTLSYLNRYARYSASLSGALMAAILILGAASVKQLRTTNRPILPKPEMPTVGRSAAAGESQTTNGIPPIRPHSIDTQLSVQLSSSCFLLLAILCGFNSPH